MRTEQKTLIDLVVGIVICAVIFSLVGIIIWEDRLAIVLGFALGSATAIIVSVHMLQSIEKELEMDPDSATKLGKKSAIFRIMVMGMVIAASMMVSKYLNPVAVFLGLLNLKFSAYLQPVVRRLITSRWYR